MKKITTLILSALLFISMNGIAQITWDFGATGSLTAYPVSGIPANITVDSLKRGNPLGTPTAPLLTTSSASTGYTGATGNGNAGVPARIGALDYTVNASTGSAFFEVTLTPDPGYFLSLSNISFGSRSTSTGPRRFSIRISTNSFMTEIAGDTINSAVSTWGLRTQMLSVTGTPGTPITLRIYGYAGTGSATPGTVNFRIDDLKVSATATLAPPSVTLQPVDQNVCEGTATGFDIYAAGPNTYQWEVDMGSGFVPVTDNAIYSGSTTDSLGIADATGLNGYVYHCIVTNGAGNTTSNDAVLTASAPVIPTVTIPSSIPVACAGDPATISATGTNEGSSPYYEWFWVGFGSVGTGPTLNVPPGFLPAGTHQIYCVLTSNAACAAPAIVTSDTLIATVNPTPATPVINANVNELYTTQYDFYQWYIGSTPLGVDSSEMATASGVYTVVVTNTFGCSSTSAPYNFVLTSVSSEFANGSVELYPNPSNGQFSIDLGTVHSTLNVSIYNIVGKMIFQKEYATTNKPSIDLSNQPNGSYFVIIKTSDRTITKKIVINK